MATILSRLFPQSEQPEPLTPGLYPWMTPDDAPVPYRLHLRVEEDGTGVLIVNAVTILHLNLTATDHAMKLIEGLSEDHAVEALADRYNVDRNRVLRDHQEFRDRILTLATNPEIDPVQFLDMDRQDPFDKTPSSPYRVDLALTYRCDSGGTLDPLARRRVNRELSQTEWENIITLLWEAGVPHVTFTGGEPTLREDLLHLVTHAETQGQVTGLMTDGKRLSDFDYLDTLAQAGLDHILISLDPADPTSEQGFHNAIASDVFTAVHLTLSPQTIDRLETDLERIQEWGAPAVSLSASEQTGEMSERLVSAREHAADLGLDLIWDLPAPYSATNPISLELETPPNSAGRAWLYVEPDGDILPAQGVDVVLGNLLREGWSEIWSAARSKTS